MNFSDINIGEVFMPIGKDVEYQKVSANEGRLRITRLVVDFSPRSQVRRSTRRAADGTKILEPQWICMTCKTVIGPVVDDDEHRCKCKDDYLVELWRVSPIVETSCR